MKAWTWSPDHLLHLVQEVLVSLLLLLGVGVEDLVNSSGGVLVSLCGSLGCFLLRGRGCGSCGVLHQRVSETG